MDQGMFVWMLVLTLSQILTGVAAAASLRRKPSLPEELYRDFVRKEEVDAMIARQERVSGEIFGVLRLLQQSVETSLREYWGALGRIEGKLDEHLRQHKALGG